MGIKNRSKADLWSIERGLREQGYDVICGVDEAGRGPLAGAVFAAAAVLPFRMDLPGLDDSKKLSEKVRNALYDEITAKAIAYGIARASNLEIDEINILQATYLAMNRAVDSLSDMLRAAQSASVAVPAESCKPDKPSESYETNEPGSFCKECGQRAVNGNGIAGAGGFIDIALIDGNRNDGIECKSICVVGGDGKSASIAAASILAKVSRDRYMIEMAKKFPGYGFEKHKGYGTKLHYEKLKELGPCEIHRKTFLRL